MKWRNLKREIKIIMTKENMTTKENHPKFELIQGRVLQNMTAQTHRYTKWENSIEQDGMIQNKGINEH